MKKAFVLVFSIFVILFITGCTEETPISDPLNDEFIRIYSLIPGSFSNDLNLPQASESFDVLYEINNEEVIDGILEYELLPEDKNIEIEMTLSKDDFSEKFNITIIQIGNEEEYEQAQIDLAFYRIYLNIAANIPGTLTSNLTLPVITKPYTEVLYSVDCTTIVRGRVVYTFPETKQSCNITATIIYKGEMRNQVFPVFMSSVEELPRVPEIYITTQNSQEILSNEEYVMGSLTLVTNGSVRFDELLNAPLGIRLRGNSTLYMPKKSYKIKFDSQQRLMSTYSEKDWVLLANFSDQTLIRNYLAYSMSAKFGMEFTPSFSFVDVYVNGEYQGNYMLTDQIEVTNHRVDIEENVPDIDTGYLIEYDWGLYRIGLDNTDENYFLIDGLPFVIKSPNANDDHYSNEHKVYIENYMNQLFDTLESKGDYSSLIDESTFIDWFIISEIFKNVDSGYSSVYLYKDKDGLLKMGPVWDFDLSTGNPGHLGDDLRGPEGWYTARQDKNILLYHLMQYPEFTEHLKERWNELYDKEILGVLDSVFKGADSMTYSRYMNFQKWDIIGKNYDWYTAPEIYDLKTYDEQVWFLYDFLDTRIAWLNQEINELD